LDRRLGGPQIRSGRGGEEKNYELLPGFESPIIQHLAQSYTTEISRLLEATKYWRKLHKDEFHNLYSPPNIIIAIKLRRMILGHVASIGDLRKFFKILSQIFKGHLADTGRNKDDIKKDLGDTGNEVIYCSGIQPGVRVPPGVRDDILGGT
jgi:hypothetical protein